MDIRRKRLEIEIDARLIAFSEIFDVNNNNIDHIVQNLGFSVPLSDLDNWRYNVLSGLLWARGEIIRNQHLSFYNPFNQPPLPETSISIRVIPKDNYLYLTNDNWKKELVNKLSNVV